MPDDLSGLDAEFQERLQRYFYGEEKMAEKEACFDRYTYYQTPDAAPLDDPWFWPDDVQPMPREESSPLEPFWR